MYLLQLKYFATFETHIDYPFQFTAAEMTSCKGKSTNPVGCHHYADLKNN